MAERRRLFWDKKILSWEESKYSPGRFFDLNRHVKNRLKMTAKLVAGIAPGKTLVDLGCGSGRFLESVAGSELKGYIGVDISSAAIEAAEIRAKRLELKFPVNFLRLSASEALQDLDGDSVVSLGLIDWLDFAELSLLHSCYVYLSHGRSTPHYVPRYYREEKLRGFLKKPERCSVYRPINIGIVRFLYNVPLS